MFGRVAFFGHCLVTAPIVERTIPIIIVKVEVRLRAVERFVRVKYFDPQQVVVRVLVGLEPIDRPLEGAL